MGILKILFLFIFPATYASDYCQFSVCGNDSILIRFPFQVASEQNSNCGYPGFNLICTNNSKTMLKLPYSGEFYVRNINYLSQKIQVYDPDNCLPQRFLSLNVSGSPFIPSFTHNYTFISCPFQNAGSQFIPIDCLSTSTNFVSAIPSLNLTNPLPESCYIMTRLSVPLTRPEQQYHIHKSYRDELSGDLLLTWDRPDCTYCESNEQFCGFDQNNNNQLFCYQSDTSSQHGLQVFRILTLCIAGPAAIFAIIMACCVCYKDRIGNMSNNNRHAASTISPAPQQEIVMTTGLDELTIESYEKVVLGESRRVPGPNSGCCWICLSEYNSKETIRCIPECKHCFHADCIDEWLRINTTCPVCRNSPSITFS